MEDSQTGQRKTSLEKVSLILNLESCEVIPISPIGPLGECPVRSRPFHCISFLAGSSVAWGGLVFMCLL
jgi:hypothetical protein